MAFERVRTWVRRWFMFVGVMSTLGFIAGVWLVVWAIKRKPEVPPQVILELALERPVVERQEPGLASLLGGEATSLRDLVDAIDRARTDDRVRGLMAFVGGRTPGMASTQELRDAIARFRKSGKPTLAYSETFGEAGPGNGGYYLATAFDQVWLQPSGDVGLVGLSADSPFLKDTFEMLGIKVRGDHRKEYKNALNLFTERQFTDAHREATQTILTDVFDQMLAGISAGRSIDKGALKALVDKGPFLAKEALGHKLVDRLGYRDEALAELRKRIGGNADTPLLFAERYLERAGRPNTSGTRLALIYGVGPVNRGIERRAPIDDDAGMAADAIGAAFRAAVADGNVKAIVFRVDSPGGSYVASDTIWRHVALAQQAGRPVIVSMGNTAASGGYFVAANATKIVASPGTLTGSIGVLGMKPVVRDFLAKVGVRFDGVATSANATMWSPLHDFDDAEWARFSAWLDRVYEDFTKKVGEGRKLAAEKVEAVAKGRVWTGQRALALGLVDELGGLDKAFELAREAAGLKPDAAIEIVEFPKEKGWLERLRPEPAESSETEGVAVRGPVLEVPGTRAVSKLAAALERLGLGADGDRVLTMPPLDVSP